MKEGESAAQQILASQLKQESVQAGAEEARMLTFESMDEEVCPAECITEVFTAKEFKQQCQVCFCYL
jgi:hypothetical protein